MPYDVLTLSGPGTAARLPTLRDLMREVAQPVAVVSGTAGTGDSRPIAMTVSSVTSVSLDPPLVLFCPSRSSRTWAAIAPTGRFVLNVLTEHQAVVASWFGGRAGGRSADQPGHAPVAVDWTWTGDLPALTCAAATATCRVVAVHPGGDHDIVVASTDEVVTSGPVRPLSYWRGGYTTVGEVPSC